MLIFGSSTFEITSFGSMAVLVVFLIINLILIAKKKSSVVERINVLLPLIITPLVFYTFLELMAGSTSFLKLGVGGWPPPYGIEIVVNTYNSIILIFASISMLIVFLSLRTEKITHLAHVLFILLFIGVFGILHTGDLFNLFVYTEVMSIASYGLAAISNERGRYGSALYYAFSSSFASILFLVGVFITYTTYGTLNLAEIRAVTIQPIPAVVFASVFILTSLIFKMAIAPFYLWKVKLMRTTNVPFAFFLGALAPVLSFYVGSKLMVDFNILILKPVCIFLSLISGISGLIVIVMAFHAKNLMESLAYGSISQIALAFMLFTSSAINSKLMIYSMIHLVNVMIFETLIFGSLVLRGGLVKEYIEMLFSAGVVSSMGVPLTSGFISKYLAVIGLLKTSIPLFMLGLVLVISSIAYGINAYNLRKEFHYRRSARNGIPQLSVMFAFFALAFLMGVWYEPLIRVGEIMRNALVLYG